MGAVVGIRLPWLLSGDPESIVEFSNLRWSLWMRA